MPNLAITSRSNRSHVAGRFNYRADISFNTRLVSANFEPASNSWRVKTDTGHQLCARFLLMATDCLSNPNCIR
ncbi:MAG: hypothetical protein VCF25_09030 [Candidatus Poribacteria bacterium]